MSGDLLADSLEKEIQTDFNHYKKLKDIAQNGIKSMEDKMRKGSDEAGLAKMKTVCNAYKVMLKIVEVIHKKK